MASIRVLPDQVANQIAAGEVVERPASIVKELVENSIDAGARSIDIEFKKGGAHFIGVSDDGRGMSQDDALLSLERHATSKISSAQDLDALSSMGFRGEAIPSIASVSRFVLQTREEGSDSGTEILVDAGKLIHCRDCGMPAGTRVSVSNLFNSVPARRKFLKTEATETAHIVHNTRLYALAHPEIAFSLNDASRSIFSTPVCADLRGRVGEIFGRASLKRLIDMDESESGMRIHGLIGMPGHSRSSRHEMLIFVNGRPVDSRTLGYALIESYYGHIPKGRYPLAFLFLELPPDQVDVNVHPSKREIRFRKEAHVRGFAVRSILKALRSTVEIAKAPVEKELRKASVPPASIARERVFSNRIPVAAGPIGVEQTPSAEALKTGETDARPPPDSGAEVSQATPREDGATASAAWRFIGWAQSEFCLFDTDKGIIILDTIAARKRVIYEEMLEDFAHRSAGRQKLLLPAPVELDPVSAAALSDNVELLERFGLEACPFGRNFFRIEAIPSWLPEGEAESYLRDLVEMLRHGSLSDKTRSANAESVARRASNRLIYRHEDLTEGALDHLVRRLFQTENPLADPDGRPTFIEISRGEMRRRFHR